MRGWKAIEKECRRIISSYNFYTIKIEFAHYPPPPIKGCGIKWIFYPGYHHDIKIH